MHTNQETTHPYLPDVSKGTSHNFSSHYFISSTNTHDLITRSALFPHVVMRVKHCKLGFFVHEN